MWKRNVGMPLWENKCGGGVEDTGKRSSEVRVVAAGVAMFYSVSRPLPILGSMTFAASWVRGIEEPVATGGRPRPAIHLPDL